MNQILTSLEQSSNWKDLMRASCKKNGLKTALVSELTPLKLEVLGNRFIRSYEHLGQKVANTWIENELKAYQWILVALSGFQQIRIKDFQEEQWDLLQSIFQFKSRSFLKFEAKRLIEVKMKNKNWTPLEDLRLKELIEKAQNSNSESNSKSIQWNDIARTLFELSQQKIFKTGKHCRERWLNYLDPSKQRGQWTKEEDFFLINQVSGSGKKWAEYASKLNRTEHTVKNRFNSLLLKQKKITPHIKKEDRLIEQIITRFNDENNHNDPKREQSEIFEIQEEMSVERSDSQYEENLDQFSKEKILIKDGLQESPCELKDSKQIRREEKKFEKVRTIDDFQKSEVKDEVQDDKKQMQVPEVVSSLVRDSEGDNKNYMTAQEFGPIVSPFWTYSPNNGTPNNGFLSSPSPLSFYINYSFTNSIHKFLPPNTYSQTEKEEK